MTSNSQVIIQDIRTDFEKMLEYVTGEQAQTATADRTERGLFKMLIEMGLKLLTLFFCKISYFLKLARPKGALFQSF
jgi:hypothetical protein